MHRDYRTARTAVDIEPYDWRAEAQELLDKLNRFCSRNEGDDAEDNPTLDEFIAFRRGQFMKRDHIGPQPGKCFMSLNLTDQQFAIVQDALIKNGVETEAALAQICEEWLKHADLISAQPQLLKSFHELLDFADCTLGKEVEMTRKARAAIDKAEGNT